LIFFFPISGDISKFFKLIVFEQILAKYGNFGKIWADSTTLAVAKSMPEARLKSYKPSNSSIANPKATWSGSLKSYHPYLLLQKNSLHS
jgi:hypothetical protein